MFRKIKKTNVLLQTDPVECGAICLSIILDYFRIKHDLSSLKQLSCVSQDGCSAFSLVQALESFGLDAQAKRYMSNEVKKKSLLQILFFNNNHFVVFEGFLKGKFYINDPALGRYTLNEKDFRARYTNLSIVVFNKRKFKFSFSFDYSLLFPLFTGFLVGILFCMLSFLFGHIFSQLYLDKFVLDNKIIFFGLFAMMAMSSLFFFYKKFFVNKFSSKFFRVQRENILKLKNMPPNFFDFRPASQFSQAFSQNFISYLDFNKSTWNLSFSIGFILVILAAFFVVSITIFSVVLSFLLVNFALLKLFSSPLRQYADQQYQADELLKKEFSLALDLSLEWQNSKDEQLKVNQLISQELFLALFSFKKKGLMLLLLHLDVVVFFINVSLILIIGVKELNTSKILFSDFFALLLFSPFLQAICTEIFIRIFKKQKYIKVQSVMRQLDYVDHKKVAYAEKNEENLVSLSKINFYFKDKENLLFNDLNLNIQKNKIYALVSSMSEGKSTLLKIIGQEQNFSEGLITIFNPKKEDFLFSLIDDKSGIFQGSLLENVCLFDENIEEKQIAKALDDALLNELYYNRPLGLLAPIQRDGLNISFGQKKRLMLARSFYHNVELLLLDDLFFSQDEKTALKLLENIKNKNITCLFTPSTQGQILKADEVIFLSQKKVLAKGSHGNLMKTNDDYKQIFMPSNDLVVGASS